MTPERSGHKILIVVHEPMLAALLGTVVEAARYAAAFPGTEESPAQALERVKPLAAVLLDLDESSGGSDLFVSRAKRSGIPVLALGMGARGQERAEWAREHELAMFTLPAELERLELKLESLIPDVARPRADRDRRGLAERRPDGRLVFTDSAGVVWSVYDRRGADRRNSVDRRFVNEQGEERHCLITEQEARVTTVSVLSDQLQRSH